MAETPEVDAAALALNAYARAYGDMVFRAIVAEANLAACEDKLKRAMAEAEAKAEAEAEVAAPVRKPRAASRSRSSRRSQA